MKAFGLGSPSAKTLPLQESSSSSSEEDIDSGGSIGENYEWCVDGWQEAQPQQIGDDAKDKTKAFIEHMDEAKGKHVRLYDDGSTVECISMVEGPSGFLLASWADGSFTRTEIPSILHKRDFVYKKPATKRPTKEAHVPPAAKPAENAGCNQDDGEMAGSETEQQPKKKATKKTCDVVDFEFPPNRFELFPKGCAKCRGRKGCTRSCWIYRLKLNK